MQLGLLLFTGHHTYQAVVAEFIGQLAIQAQPVRVFLHILDLGFRAAAGGEIELIALVGQLRNAGIVDGLKGPHGGLHFQTVKIFAVVRKAGHLHGALGVGLIHFVAGKIILGKRGHLKISAVIQCADILFGALHHRHRNAGHIGLYDRALGGVIVHKHKAVGAKAQLGSSFDQIAVLIFPVGLDGHKILGLQRAVRML